MGGVLTQRLGLNATAGVASYAFTASGFATGTSTGNVDYTASLGGATPKAALIVASNQLLSSEPGEEPSATVVFGVITSSGQATSYSISEDNLASTNCFSNSRTDRALLVGGTSAASGTLIADGMRLDYSTNSSDKRFTAMFFSGSGIDAKSGTVNLGTGTSAIDVTTTFDPDVVILFGEFGTFSNSAISTGMKYQFGIAVNDGSATQRCVVYSEEDNQGAGEPYQSLLTDCAIAVNSQTNGSIVSKVAVGFASGKFTLTPTASYQSRVAAYLALDLGTRPFKLVSFDTPTTTGSHSISGAGFTPVAAIIVTTNRETVDTSGATSDVQSGFGISLLGENDKWANSWRMDSGADPTDTASNSQNVALMGASATDNDAIKATFTAWTSDGVTLNYSATQGNAKKCFALFLGA